MSASHLPGCRCGKFKETLGTKDLWYVNAPAYYNCFFTYMRYNHKSHTLSEIAQKLDLSISAITAIERKALDKFKRRVDALKFEK